MVLLLYNLHKLIIDLTFLLQITSSALLFGKRSIVRKDKNGNTKKFCLLNTQYSSVVRNVSVSENFRFESA